MDIRKVLYIPKASKQLFLLIAAGQMDNKSETMRWGMIVSQNRIPFIISKPHRNKLHYFDLELTHSVLEVPNTAITTVSCDYILWHRRMGHAHQCMIKNLTENTKGGPNNIMVWHWPKGMSGVRGPGWGLGSSVRLRCSIEPVLHPCLLFAGFISGSLPSLGSSRDPSPIQQGHLYKSVRDVKKSKWLPSSKSRAARPIDLVHSNLDEFPVHSISSYKWTTTYLDNHSSYGVIFYLKSKDEEFTAFKAYQAWAERQTSTTLKCKWTKTIFEREWNWTPNVNAWLTTTEWTSRKVPANHCKWSRGHTASCLTLKVSGYMPWKLRFIHITSHW